MKIQHQGILTWKLCDLNAWSEYFGIRLVVRASCHGVYSRVAPGGLNRTPSWVEVRAKVGALAWVVCKVPGGGSVATSNGIPQFQKGVNKKMQKNILSAKIMRFVWQLYSALVTTAGVATNKRL